ncbi:MAG: hypothetical protein ACXWDN_03465 [Limisphaerales bacterium]
MDHVAMRHDRTTNEMAGMEHEGHSGSQHEMHGFYGKYPMTREASGTSWQPEITPMQGVHWMTGDWMLMAHGFAYGIYDNQGGSRGDDKFFSANMAMLMAQHPLGPGTFGLRSMLSLEPATIGRQGYPLLLQTGETSDGKAPLIDRQHPHDLFMELAATYSVPLQNESSAFVYFGMPGEPALGPPTYMHRFSAMDDPEAPITHHWLDSTHITFGVATVGYIWKDWKLDASIFTGREPDQYRWDFDTARFDSYCARLQYNPREQWSFQVSYGHIKSPEQLEPGIDVDRLTASASYYHRWESNIWATTFAWGQNRNDPGKVLDGFLLESTLVLRDKHTVFGRGERVSKDELFPSGSLMAGEEFTVNKISLGYIYDFATIEKLKLGLGGLGSIALLPASLETAYGDTPVSFMIFVRAKL